MSTPKLTNHARERCVEMHISTKRAKRVVRNADVRRPAERGAVLATWQGDPAIAVIYVEDQEPVPLITSVVWRTREQYERKEGGYDIV